MSRHYTLTFNMKLKRDLTTDLIETLHHLFNAEGPAPQQLPSHPFFKDGLPRYLPGRAYAGFAPGSWRSEYWQSSHVPGGQGDGQIDSGVNLLIPGNKLEGVLSLLPMLCWLATISDSAGYVGTAMCDDDGKGMPLFMLFVVDGQLKIAAFPDDVVLESAEGISG